MSKPSRSLPQAIGVDAAMAPACTLPTTDRTGRRVDVQAVVSMAIDHLELEDGVAFVFDNSDDVARLLLDLVLAERTCCARFAYSLRFGSEHQPIELRVQAVGALVQPLKDMYFGLIPVRS
jgi:hypothetical protein